MKASAVKMDTRSNVQLARADTMKNKSGIGTGLASAIGSGIGGGLRKPT